MRHRSTSSIVKPEGADLISTNKDLELALADIRQLSGMLPICSTCKKIRDDSGYWERIEAYVQEYCEIKFNRSLCTECMNALHTSML